MRLVCLFLFFILLSVFPGLLRSQSDNFIFFYTKDAQNRQIRTIFDQGNRFYLGASYCSSLQELETPNANFIFWELKFLQRWKSKAELNDFWKNQIQVFEMKVNFEKRNPDDLPALTAALFHGEFVQYTPASMLTIGATRLQLPFNFGFKVDAGSISINNENARYEFGIIDSRLLMDFWKNPEQQDKLLLGIGIHYDIIYHKEFLPHKTEHQIAPFTALSLGLHHESKNNLRILEILLDYTPVWSNHFGWGANYQMQIGFEWIFISINDQPVSLNTKIAYCHKSFLAHHNNELQFTLTLGISFQTRE